MNVSNQQAQVVSGRARRVTVAASVLLLMQLAAAAHAGPNEQAKRIYERIAGEEPPAATLTQMATRSPTSPGPAGLLAAAAIATQAPDFYNVTVKNMVTPWTNRDQTVFAPLNDYTATVIGMVRDDVAVQYRAVGGHSLYGERRRPAGGLGSQQQSLRDCRNQRRGSEHRAQADHAVGDLRDPDRGDRGPHHHPRGGVGLLHQRHQPRDVPLHHDQSPVQ